MTDPLYISGGNLSDLGQVVFHSSDVGGGPDVGISVGLGSEIIYAGEVPGLKGGWSLVIYGVERTDIAETVDREAAIELIEAIELAIKAANVGALA